MHAILFNLTEKAPQNAHSDIQNFLEKRGFRRVAFGVYFKEDPVLCVTAVLKMSEEFTWLEGVIESIRLLKIKDDGDLKPALKKTA